LSRATSGWKAARLVAVNGEERVRAQCGRRGWFGRIYSSLAFRALGFEAAVAWIVVGLGVLVAAVGISVHFGKVRSKVP
jgi:hypothetical protein